MSMAFVPATTSLCSNSFLILRLYTVNLLAGSTILCEGLYCSIFHREEHQSRLCFKPPASPELPLYGCVMAPPISPSPRFPKPLLPVFHLRSFYSQEWDWDGVERKMGFSGQKRGFWNRIFEGGEPRCDNIYEWEKKKIKGDFRWK